MFQLMDGDIIVYQLEPPADAHYELPTALDYFKDLFYKVKQPNFFIYIVTFYIYKVEIVSRAHATKATMKIFKVLIIISQDVIYHFSYFGI